MDTTKKILIITGTCIVLAIGGFILINNINSTKETPQKDYSDIYNNIETETKTKSVQFDTIEEMMDYSQQINSINSIEEIEVFLTNYYKSCAEESIEKILIYYNSEIWDTVLDKQAYPYFDESRSVDFSIENLKVTEGESPNTYIAQYNLVVTYKETNKKIAEFKRKDTFELSKIFEKIEIMSYKRETLEEKYF